MSGIARRKFRLVSKGKPKGEEVDQMSLFFPSLLYHEGKSRIVGKAGQTGPCSITGAVEAKSVR